MKHSILCLDDEIDNVEALERLFRKKYKVFKATSGAEGLEVLKKEPISLIISDQRMPNMTGVEFFAKSMKTHPDAIRILLTGYTDIESIIDAINSGQVYRYVTKPWDPVDLANTVDKAVEKYELSHELKEKNAALKKAFADLKVLDEAKNHFMILINHELKTPLTVILSYLQLISDTNLDADQKKYLKRILESSNRLHALINDVLELVSAETGVLKIHPKKISTKKIIEGIEQTFTENAEQKKLKFVFDVEDHPVYADPKIIRSVLNRVIDNAIKFGEQKSEILIESHVVGDKIQLSVTNEGKGINKDSIEKVLKPFSLDEDIMHHSKGTGLGLSISQALLRTHQSELSIACPKGLVKVSFELSAEA